MSMSFTEYAARDGLALAELVRSGEVSAAELLEVAIARVEEVNPSLNAIAYKLYEQARAQVKKPLPEGPFSGVPFMLKDLYLSLAGTITSNGSRFFQEAVAQESSTIVSRYQQAGLVIFAKTTTAELGMSAITESHMFGITRNPWHTEYSPGGSSGGAGAVVAAGIVPMANGNDHGGSIRIPASCCGLFGFKPSYGRTPIGPQITSDFGVVHALTRSVRDSAALLDACTRAAPDERGAFFSQPTDFIRDVDVEPGRLRIALVREPVFGSLPVHAECTRALEQAAMLCESLGHDVEEVAPPIPAEHFRVEGGIGAVGSVEFLLKVRAQEQRLGRKVQAADLNAHNYTLCGTAPEVSGEAYAQGRELLGRTQILMAEFQQRYDVLLSPTLATLPPKVGLLDTDEEYQVNQLLGAFTMIYNITGQPAMSVPLHWTMTGLPVGVMFAGRNGEDATLFRLAAQLERARPWFMRVPR